MKINSQEFVTVPIGHVRQHPRNPNQGDIGAICQSIEANGFYGALLVQKSTGYILAGNHTWVAAHESGLTELPVILIDVDDDAALKIMLSDNRHAELAQRDLEVLSQLLRDLADGDPENGLDGTGYTGDDLDEILADLASPSLEQPAAGGEEGSAERQHGINYQSQYGVVVTCTGEQHQQEVYEALVAEGYACRVVVV